MVTPTVKIRLLRDSFVRNAIASISFFSAALMIYQTTICSNEYEANVFAGHFSEEPVFLGPNDVVKVPPMGHCRLHITSIANSSDPAFHDHGRATETLPARDF